MLPYLEERAPHEHKKGQEQDAGQDKGSDMQLHTREAANVHAFQEGNCC
jgi:hypothetical protein